MENITLWFMDQIYGFLFGAALGGVVMFLGNMIYGRRHRQRLAALEAAAKSDSPPLSVTNNNIINVNGRPVARLVPNFEQKFELLDTVVAMPNGQVLTFFVPKITVEYLDSGERESLELPKAKFEEVAERLDAAVRANSSKFAGWEALGIRCPKCGEKISGW